MKTQNDTNNISLTITKGHQKDVLIGQIEQFPSIIVQSNNIADIVKEAGIALDGYLKAFPEEKDKIEKQISKAVISPSI